MIRLFCGYDPREAIGFHTFVHSVVERCGEGVQITPLVGEQRDGTNRFTYARFSVPELCDFKGWAIYVDACDMLLRRPLRDLMALADSTKAVQVVKHYYVPKADRKYIGTEMEAANEDYPRKNWSSVILWNCSAPAHRKNLDWLQPSDGSYLHRFKWLEDEQIGELPIEWNWLDEYGENDKANIVHWTNGIPGFYHYRNAPHAQEWKDMARAVNRGMA